jgi:tetratricopeptide (TPR) repeat protein
MRYLCVHCDKTFEHEGTKKPRCPTCLRVNGLEEVVAPTKDQGGARAIPWPFVAAGVALVALGVGYALWSNNAADTVEGDAPLAPLDRSAVLGYLRNAGVDPGELGALLLPTDGVEAFASNATGSSEGMAAADAIFEALRDRVGEGAYRPFSFGVPLERAFFTPDETLAAVQEDGARHHLYPLELASLLATALRSEGLVAMVGEAFAFEGGEEPPDPSGQFGYYVVNVYEGEDTDGEPARVLDPYQARAVDPAAVEVLTDVQAIGGALGIEALRRLVHETDPDEAMELSQRAVRLYGRSPTLRSVRGAILVAGGQPQAGLEEFENAMRIRGDSPRRNLVAGVLFSRGEIEEASAQISEALEATPRFAPGRATLAMIHLARDETDEALAELQAAERIDRDLHTLPQLWANYYAATGDIAEAVRRARQAIERNPGDVQARLLAARIFRQAGDYPRMRREAREVMDRIPRGQQSQMRELIERMLGPTALEEDEEVAEVEVEVEDDLDLDLDLEGEDGEGGFQLDSPLLGGGSDGPSLLGDDDDGLLGGEGLGGGGLGGGGLLGGGGGGGLQLRLGGE